MSRWDFQSFPCTPNMSVYIECGVNIQGGHWGTVWFLNGFVQESLRETWKFIGVFRMRYNTHMIGDTLLEGSSLLPKKLAILPSTSTIIKVKHLSLFESFTANARVINASVHSSSQSRHWHFPSHRGITNRDIKTEVCSIGVRIFVEFALIRAWRHNMALLYVLQVRLQNINSRDT